MSHPMIPDPSENSSHAVDKNPRDHYVTEAWDEIDNRGICPCGEVVVWNFDTDQWDPAPQMRVILLTDEEIAIGLVDDRVRSQAMKQAIE